MQTIKLESSDGKFFEAEIGAARCSGTIRTMLDNLGIEDFTGAVPLPNVHSTILEKVLMWSNYHKDDPEDEDYYLNHEISKWDEEFLQLDQTLLYELILAASYLDIKGLLDVTCKKVANMIKGKTPEQIRETFDIENDFDSDEEEQVRKENEWCEQK